MDNWLFSVNYFDTFEHSVLSVANNVLKAGMQGEVLYLAQDER